jgi:hypothetical protein
MFKRVSVIKRLHIVLFLGYDLSLKKHLSVEDETVDQHITQPTWWILCEVKCHLSTQCRHYLKTTKHTCMLMLIYLLTAIGLTPGGSSTVHIYTQTIHRTTKKIKTIHRTTQKCLEQCGPYPVLASYTLAFALQLRKKHGKTSVRVVEL